LLQSEAVVRVLVGSVRVVLWCFWLFGLSVYMTFLFLLVPATKSLADYLQAKLAAFCLAAGTAIVGYLPNLLTIVMALLICRYLVKFIRLIMEAVAGGRIVLPGFDPDWAEATRQLLSFLTMALTAVIVAPLLPGAASPAFKGISVFIGVLISLGSGGAISHVVSGVFLTYTNAFKVGDIVRVGQVEGQLVERSLLVTRIRTPKNEEITIPNARVLEASVTNFSTAARRQELIVYSTITLGYDAPWKRVHELLLECAGRTEGLLAEPAPFVLQTSLDGSWVAYQINAYTGLAERLPRLYSELRCHIQDVFNEAGIELMTTSFHSVRDGNLSTIPEEYPRPEATGFRILKG
ncbi:MAG: mechanosensitive ion channel, partial [Candidatus Eremiobacteraeota bacterium]|nr:mechanosensitive ion channel [Candidatus Eremiobacteraeota bacterium]